MKKAQILDTLQNMPDDFSIDELVAKLNALQDSEQEFDLNDAQQEELDRRLKKYEAGEMNFSSWDTVKERIKNKVSDGQ